MGITAGSRVLAAGVHRLEAAAVAGVNAAERFGVQAAGVVRGRAADVGGVRAAGAACPCSMIQMQGGHFNAHRTHSAVPATRAWGARNFLPTPRHMGALGAVQQLFVGPVCSRCPLPVATVEQQR